jgi:hypothetical protein
LAEQDFYLQKGEELMANYLLERDAYRVQMQQARTQDELGVAMDLMAQVEGKILGLQSLGQQHRTAMAQSAAPKLTKEQHDTLELQKTVWDGMKTGNVQQDRELANRWQEAQQQVSRGINPLTGGKLDEGKGY